MDDTEMKNAQEEFNVLENLDLLISPLPTPEAVPIQVKKDPDSACPVVEFSPAIHEVFSLCHVMKDEPNLPTLSVCRITNVLSVPDKDPLAADLQESIVDQQAVLDLNKQKELMYDKEPTVCDTDTTRDERRPGVVTVSLPVTCSRINKSDCQPTTECQSQTRLLSAGSLKQPPTQCTEHFACLCTAVQNELSVQVPKAPPPAKQKPRVTCCTCQKTFSNSSHLKRHMLLHSRQFNCPECGKEFTSDEKLRKHLALPMICQICKQRFPKATNLNQHMQTHFPVILNPVVASRSASDPVRTGDRLSETETAVSVAKCQLTCEVCGREFKRASGLTLHARSHSAVRNINCSQCDKHFRRNYDLKRHMKTHERQPVNTQNVNKSASLPTATAHVCKLCGRPFTTARELTDHLELHAGLRPGRCKDCGQKLSFINVHGHHNGSHNHNH